MTILQVEVTPMKVLWDHLKGKVILGCLSQPVGHHGYKLIPASNLVNKERHLSAGGNLL